MQENWKLKFFTIWAGQAFSIIGSAAVQFAIIWWITVKTGSASALAAAGIIGFMPIAIAGPFAGVLTDRISRKAVMISADIFTALASAALAAAFFTGEPELWFIYTILFLRALGLVFHSPALQAAIPMLVPVETLQKTAAWGQFVQSASYMLGPVLGAALTASLSMPFIILTDVLGAALAVTALAAVKIPDPPFSGEKKKVWADILEGLKIIFHNRYLKRITVPVILIILVYVPVGTLFPLLVRLHFHGSAWDNGLVEFLFAFGMLASSLLLGFWKGLANKLHMIGLSFFAIGAALTASGLLSPGGFAAFAVLSAVLGFAGNFYAVPYTAIVQETVPPESMGRVFALIASMMSFSTPVGLFVAGPVAEAIGINTWFALSGVLILLCTVLYLFFIRGISPDKGG